MPAKSKVQYTLRGIPREVDRALRKKARERKVSLNRLLVDQLIEASGAIPRRRSLEHLPVWQEDPEFDKALEEQRQIDWEMWR